MDFRDFVVFGDPPLKNKRYQNDENSISGNNKGKSIGAKSLDKREQVYWRFGDVTWGGELTIESNL